MKHPHSTSRRFWLVAAAALALGASALPVPAVDIGPGEIQTPAVLTTAGWDGFLTNLHFTSTDPGNPGTLAIPGGTTATFTATSGTSNQSLVLDAGVVGIVAPGTGAQFTIEGNSAAYGGAVSVGGAFTVGGPGEFLIKNNSVTNNGGGIYLPNGQLSLTATRFESNSAGRYYGGGISADYSSLTLTNSSFFQNAANIGGALYLANSSTADLKGILFQENHTWYSGYNYSAGGYAGAGQGGAIYVGQWSTLFVEDSQFTGNTADGSGGALHIMNASATLTDTNFTNNSATWGGAIAMTQRTSGNHAALTLRVTEGHSAVFSGNQHQSGISNSINMDEGALLVDIAQGATLDMRDPMRASGSAAKSIFKSGSGVWKLGGANALSEAGASLTFQLQNGDLRLYRAGEEPGVAAASLTLGNAGSLTLATGAALLAAGDNALTTPLLAFEGGALAFDFSPASLVANASGTWLALEADAISGAPTIDIRAALADIAPGTAYAVLSTGSGATLPASTRITLNGVPTNVRSSATGIVATSLSPGAGNTLLFMLLSAAAPAATSLTWTGAANRDWRNDDGTTLAPNWTGTLGTTPVNTYLNGDSVRFADTGAGTVAIAAEGVQPAAVTVETPQNYAFTGGSIVGPASLIKLGAGTLTLTNENTYTGGTFVNGGTLQLGDGSSNAGSVHGDIALANGATVAFNHAAIRPFAGTVSGDGHIRIAGQGAALKGYHPLTGTVTVESGATLQIGSNGAGTADTLKFGGNVFLANNATLALDLLPGGTDSDLLLVAGNISLAPGASINLNFNTPLIGEYVLIDATNNLAPVFGADGSAFAATFGGAPLPATLTATFSYANDHTLLLTIGEAPVVPPGERGNVALLWKATANNFWHHDPGKSDANWSGTAPTGPVEHFENGDTVTFADIGAGTIAIATEGVQPAAVTVETPQNYAFTGGAIAGTASLIKLGAGTLTLTNENTYTGGTFVNGGTLQLGDGSSNTGSVQGDIALENGATVAFNHTTIRPFAGTVSGDGHIRIAGQGAALKGYHPLTGTVTVESGATLQIGSNGAGTADTLKFGGNVFFANNATLALDLLSGGTDSDLLLVAGNISLAPGASINLNFNAPLIGEYVLMDAANNLAPVFGADGSALAATFGGAPLPATLTATFSYANDHTLLLTIGEAPVVPPGERGNVALLWKATANNFWHHDPGKSDANWSGTAPTGPVEHFENGDTVTFADMGAGIVVIATEGVQPAAVTVDSVSDYAFTGGPIAGPASLIKLGPGTLTFTNENTYTGGTFVSGGTLQLGDGSSNTGSVHGDIALANGATVAFNHATIRPFSGTVHGDGTLSIRGAGVALAGSHPVSAAVISPGATLQVGTTNSPVPAILKLGSAGSTVTFLSGAILALDLFPGDAADLLLSDGNITFVNGGTITLALNRAVKGTFTLMDAGSLNTNGATLDLTFGGAALPDTLAASVTVENGHLLLLNIVDGPGEPPGGLAFPELHAGLHEFQRALLRDDARGGTLARQLLDAPGGNAVAAITNASPLSFAAMTAMPLAANLQTNNMLRDRMRNFHEGSKYRDAPSSIFLFGHTRSTKNNKDDLTAPVFDFRTSGGGIGAETSKDGAAIGLTVSGWRGRSTSHRDGGEITADQFLVSTYASLHGKNFYATAILSGGATSYDSTRQNVFGENTAKTNGENFGASLEFGVDIPINKHLSLTPAAGFDSAYFGVDAFTENGHPAPGEASSVPFDIKKFHQSVFQPYLGATVKWTGEIIRVSFGVNYLHIADNEDSIKSSFLDNPALGKFTTRAAVSSEHIVQINPVIEAQIWENSSLSLSYILETSSGGMRTHAVNAAFSFRF